MVPVFGSLLKQMPWSDRQFEATPLITCLALAIMSSCQGPELVHETQHGSDWGPITTEAEPPERKRHCLILGKKSTTPPELTPDAEVSLLRALGKRSVHQDGGGRNQT